MAPSLKQEAVEPCYRVCGFLNRLQGLESSSLRREEVWDESQLIKKSLKAKGENFLLRGDVRNTGNGEVKPSQQTKRTLAGCRKVGNFERDNKIDEDVPTSLTERLMKTWF
jgi:hypothetical protein